MFLGHTIDDIFEHIEGDTEVIAVLDGQWPVEPIVARDRLTLVYFPESIGQRASINQAVRLSQARYIFKVDAHCSFDQGFDVKMMEEMRDDWCLVPLMKNLHAFDWVCEDGHRRYQGKSGPCQECGKPTHREMVWRAKPSPNSTAYRFDKTLHFQYWGDYKKRQKGDTPITMSIQGSAFMVTRDKFWELELCDEKHGSWGQQGVEVACKYWLSGGEVHVNKKTWYAHMFRTQGGDFGFPYPNPGISKARRYSRDLWFNNKWPKAIHNLDWLIEKFSPVPDWDVSKGILYYTDHNVDPKIMEYCQLQLKRAAGGSRIVSVSLQPMDFGDNLHLELERGPLTLFKQILTGLKELDTDVVFFAEHDMLYHRSHFEFVPSKRNRFWYNINVWKMRYTDGLAVTADFWQWTSGMCAYRDLLIEHYEKRIKMVEENGWNRRMGFEPGTHNRKERVDDYKAKSFRSDVPNLDIRHGRNLTHSRFDPSKFRNKKYVKGWTEAYEVPGWGETKAILKEIDQGWQPKESH